MATSIVSFTGTAESVRVAVTEAQEAANAWLSEQTRRGYSVRLAQTNTLSEVNKATAGTVYTHVISLVVDEP